jgi:uncharacterized protein DUF4304
MATPARQIADRHLRPYLTGQGFTGHGNAFRSHASNGDAMVVGLQMSSGTSKAESQFYVNLGLVPLPWLEYIRSSRNPADLAKPDPSEALVSGRLPPPNRLYWTADAQNVDQIGEAIVAGLADVLPRYLELLDRSRFRALLEQDADLPGMCPRDAALAMLLIVSGHAEPAEPELERIRQVDAESDFADWFAQD